MSCLVAKLRKVKILPLLDIVSIGFLLAQGIGRWGNFFNQEAFGTNTTSIFGMSGGRIQQWIDESYTSTSYYANFGTELDSSLPVHPCFLYESIWCLLGFVLLAIFAKKIRKYDGQIFLIYIGWYGLERAFVESLRTDSLVIGNVRISQLLAILCVIASILLQIICGLRVKRMGVDYHMYKDTAESKRLMEEESIRYRRKKKLAEESTEESPEENTDTMEAIEEEFTEETVSNSETEITAQEENDETIHDQESDNDKNNKKE